MFGAPPKSHAAAGWQINDHALALELEHGLEYASDTRGGGAFLPQLGSGVSACPQIPTTLPTFDELLGRDGIDAASIAEAVFRLTTAAPAAAPGGDGPRAPHVFTLHAELEGLLLRDSFEALLVKWREAGASLVDMAAVARRVRRQPLPARRVVLGEIPGRSGTLAVQAAVGADAGAGAGVDAGAGAGAGAP